ncbi:MAG: hypothetical protein ACC652_15870, partial [Acidimicrobiales bacterium]
MTDAKPTRTVFFVTRVGEPGSAIRERTDHVEKHILNAPVADHELTLVRADKDPTPGRISERIVRSIIDAEIVVVDATGGNPNVFYELGLAHAFGKNVILLSDSAESIPFDVADFAHIIIGDDGKIGAEEAEVAQETFAHALAIVMEAGFEPSSPVASAATQASLSEVDNPSVRALSEIAVKMEGVERKLDRVLHPSRSKVGRGKQWRITAADPDGVRVRHRDGAFIVLVGDLWQTD